MGIESRKRLAEQVDRGIAALVACSVVYWAGLLTGWPALRWDLERESLKSWLVLLTCVALALALATRFVRRPWLRSLGCLGLAGTTLFWWSKFYWTPWEFVACEIPAIGSHAGHRTALALSGLLVWLYGLAGVVRFVRTRANYAATIVYVVGLVCGAILVLDLTLSGPREPVVGHYVSVRPYHPYLTYPVPDSYVYCHATERSVKDLRGREFLQQKPAGITRIVLCGASTVWGHDLQHADTLAARLEIHLRATLPQRQVEVVCVAYPGKYQLNELIDAVVVLPAWSPDLVISLNGFNEVWYGESMNRYEGMPGIEGQGRLTPMEAFLMRYTHLGPCLLKNRPRMSRGVDYPLGDPDAQVSPRYFSYLRLTARNLRTMRVPYVYAFCPNRVELAALRTGQDEVNSDGPPLLVLRARRHAAAEIVEDEGQIAYDVVACLMERPGDVFLDECHLTAEATDRLAEDLAQRIPGWLSAGPRSEKDGNPIAPADR
jgi:hypothetical protein